MQKQRFYLYKRRGVYYLQDGETGEQKSLHTKDRTEAQQTLNFKLLTLKQPVLNLTLARTLLAASDPKLVERTWTFVMDEFISRGGRDSTKNRRERGIRSKPFDIIRHRKLLETTSDELRAVLKAGGVFTNHFLRCLHNLALGLGWLPWPIIPSKLWPVAACKDKRGITKEEHQQIVRNEQNTERRAYYELLWEIGASQSDGAGLTAESIDWKEKTISYIRRKTGELSSMTIGARLEALLKTLPSQGPLFPKMIQLRDKDRSAEFRRRCRVLRIEGISLHSYRYAWAERAKTCAYPERFAQQALGHNSKAVHRAYAKGAHVKLPSLEEYENKVASQTKSKSCRNSTHPKELWTTSVTRSGDRRF
jgi:hypothetical protein